MKTNKSNTHTSTHIPQAAVPSNLAPISKAQVLAAPESNNVPYSMDMPIPNSEANLMSNSVTLCNYFVEQILASDSTAQSKIDTTGIKIDTTKYVRATMQLIKSREKKIRQGKLSGVGAPTRRTIHNDAVPTIYTQTILGLVHFSQYYTKPNDKKVNPMQRAQIQKIDIMHFTNLLDQIMEEMLGYVYK